MTKEGKKFVMPGSLSKLVNKAKKPAKPGRLSGELNIYEMRRQERVRSNQLEVEALGLKHLSKTLFLPKANQNNKTSNDKDPDYLQAVDDDEPCEAEVNKVLKWMRSRENLFLEEEALGDSPKTQEKGNITKGSDHFQHESENLGAISSSPEIATQVSRPLKRKRGPTKLNTIATDGASRIEVKFDEFGQPIDDGSIKLSSFLGALVREVVPCTLATWRHLSSEMAEVLWRSIQVRFKLEELWQKEACFARMHDCWRAHKSRLVNKINNASNEETRLMLKPDNIKLVRDWHNFVKEKTSGDFKIISEKFKNMRNKQLPTTVGRMGYARLNQKMKKESNNPKSITRADVWVKAHRKANGDPINTKVGQTIAEMEKVEEVTLMSFPTTTSLKEDALSKVLGPEKHGRVRGFGKGITASKLAYISQLKGYSNHQLEEQKEIKEQMVNLQKKLDWLEKNQCDCQQANKDDGPNTTYYRVETETEHVVVTPIEGTNGHLKQKVQSDAKCKLLDWMGTGEVVAEGRWSSSDPTALVHHVPIGPNAMRIWVDIAKKDEVYLWRGTSDMTYIDEAIGTTVAWPADKVLME